MDGSVAGVMILLLLVCVLAVWIETSRRNNNEQKADNRSSLKPHQKMPSKPDGHSAETSKSKKEVHSQRTAVPETTKHSPKAASTAVPKTSDAPAPRKKEIVCLTNYYSYQAKSINEPILSEDRYLVLDTLTGDLTDEYTAWRDVVIRPGAMGGSEKPVSYEKMYQLVDAYHVEHAEIFKQLTRENHREWLEQHRDIIYSSRFTDV